MANNKITNRMKNIPRVVRTQKTLQAHRLVVIKTKTKKQPQNKAA
ncbi:MAG TPA: hypothetical protein PKY78_06345 [Candidatus Omnitrophota bacterium]|nr:hypothetical protein [Candidatus Omnitrophota bacterium]